MKEEPKKAEIILFKTKAQLEEEKKRKEIIEAILKRAKSLNW